VNGHLVPTEIKTAEFLFGAPNLAAIRRQPLPEIAVIGRSNVGKSTFINRLCKRKLARVSGNPGSTRELNFYLVEGLRGEGLSFGISLVDMPGFGFAKLSKVERDQISRLAVSYLRERQQIRAVILLNDCRRSPGEDELAVQALCAEEGIHCIVVATKLDSEKRSQHDRLLKSVAAGYHLERGDILATGEGISTDSIWDRILTLVER
jgi:GTP-binding protein